MSETAEVDDKPNWLQSNAEEGYGTQTNEDFSSDPSQVRGGPTPTLQKAQSISTILSLLLSPIAIILVSLWVHELGGVSWSDGNSKTNFNWHPVMMITAYSLMNVGSLIFRVTNTSSYQSSIQPAGSTTVTSSNTKKRGIAKATHAGIWSSSFVLGIIGIIAVFKSHNDELSGYIANLYSLHSWVGVFVLALYTLQFLYGLVVYGFGIGRNGRLGSSTMMTLHKYSGAWINLLVMTTILLGLQEKEGFINCAYNVDEADLMPIKNYHLIPYSCKLSHGLGLVILSMGMFTSFGLAQFPRL